MIFPLASRVMHYKSAIRHSAAKPQPNGARLCPRTSRSAAGVCIMEIRNIQRLLLKK